MTIELTPELERLIKAQLDSGRYESAAEVVSQALWQMEFRQEAAVIADPALHNRLEAGLAQCESGDGADGETFLQGMLDEIDSQILAEAKRKAG